MRGCMSGGDAKNIQHKEKIESLGEMLGFVDSGKKCF